MLEFALSLMVSSALQTLSQRLGSIVYTLYVCRNVLASCTSPKAQWQHERGPSVACVSKYGDIINLRAGCFLYTV